MPSTATDRLNGLTTSVAVKAPCRVGTTAAITLSGLQTIDGVALAAGDRVLVKNQSSAVDNGVWVAGSGTWSRATDFNGSLDAVGGTLIMVTSGAVNANSYWQIDGYGEVVIGTDSIVFETTSGNLSLQADLASTATGKGASMVGADTGGTVEDAIWHVGRAAPIAGSKMQINWLRDDATYPLEDEAGIWAGKVVTDHGITNTFGAADGQAGSPCAAFFAKADNNGSPGDVCAAIFSAVARANSTTVFGANIIARGSAAHSSVKYVGLEVDVVPHASDTSISSASGGLYINIFNKAISGPAIMTGAVSSGTFGNGIILGGIVSTGTGLALESSSQANSLLNTTVGTFNGVALTLGNGQSRGIKLTGTAAAHAFIYNDGSNNVREVLGSGSWIWRNNADSTSLVSISDAAGQGVVNVETASGEYRVAGTKVLGARGAAVADATGAGDVVAQLNTLLARCRAHGIIAT